MPRHAASVPASSSAWCERPRVDPEPVRQIFQPGALVHQRAGERQSVEEDQLVDPRQPGREPAKHRHVELWPLWATSRSSPTKARNAGQTSARWAGRRVGVVVAVDRRRARADRPRGADQLLELIHGHPPAHPDRRELDDVARAGVHLGGLEVEGDVVLQRVGEAAALQQLQRLEHEQRAKAPGRSTSRAAPGGSPGVEPATRSPTTALSIGISARSTPRSGSTQTIPRASRPSQPLGQLRRARDLGRIAELRGALVQRVAVAADPLGQQLVHQVRSGRASGPGRQVLHVEHEAPRLSRLGIAAAWRGRTRGARRAARARRCAARTRCTSGRGQHLVGERLDRSGSSGRADDPERRRTKPITSSSASAWPRASRQGMSASTSRVSRYWPIRCWR